VEVETVLKVFGHLPGRNLKPESESPSRRPLRDCTNQLQILACPAVKELSWCDDEAKLPVTATGTGSDALQ
jgi:hypothetical protein